MLLRRTFVLLVLAGMACMSPIGSPAGPALAQHKRVKAPESEQWYHWTNDGVRHYVYGFGRAAAPGDTVVVLHGGWGAEHSYLIEPFRPLADRYRFVLYDQRGSLRSPAPDSTISLDRLVADLEHLRGALGLDQVTLAAHSMGNALAYAYLDAHPERVKGLVLIGAVHPVAYAGRPNMAFIKEVWPEADSAVLADAQQDFLEDAQQRAKRLAIEEGLLPDSLRDVPAEDLDPYQLGDDRVRTRAWRIFFTAVNTCSADNWRAMRGGQVFYKSSVARAIMSDPDYEDQTEAFWPALKAYQGPVEVIMGTCDYVDIGPAVWPRIADRLPNAELHVVENAGHALWMDRPEAFQQVLVDALAEATQQE